MRGVVLYYTGSAMRRLGVLLLLLLPLIYASTINVDWFLVKMTYVPTYSASIQGYLFIPKIEKIVGPLLGVSPSSTSTLLCLRSDEPVSVAVKLRLDIAKRKDVDYKTYFFKLNGADKYCIPIDFLPEHAGGNLKDILDVLKLGAGFVGYFLFGGSPFGFLSSLLGFALKSKVEGVYLQVLMSDGKNVALLYHYLYQGLVSDGCLKVSVNETPFVPDQSYTLTLTNDCNTTVTAKLRLNIKLASDIFLKSVTLEPHQSKKVKVYIPAIFGIRHEKLKYDSDYIRSLDVLSCKYVCVPGEPCTQACKRVAAVPVFDYALYYLSIKENYRVTWVQGGHAVDYLTEGQAAACYSLTPIHPHLRVDRRISFLVIEDRRWMPDRVVASKVVDVRSFDDLDLVCVKFYARESLLVRGYKLVLAVTPESQFTLSEIYVGK